MNELTACLKDIVFSVQENARETRQRLNFADASETDYIQGRLSAYIEILDLLKLSAQEHGVSARELGL